MHHHRHNDGHQVQHTMAISPLCSKAAGKRRSTDLSLQICEIACHGNASTAVPGWFRAAAMERREALHWRGFATPHETSHIQAAQRVLASSQGYPDMTLPHPTAGSRSSEKNALAGVVASSRLTSHDFIRSSRSLHLRMLHLYSLSTKG